MLVHEILLLAVSLVLLLLAFLVWYMMGRIRTMGDILRAHESCLYTLANITDALTKELSIDKRRARETSEGTEQHAQKADASPHERGSI